MGKLFNSMILGVGITFSLLILNGSGVSPTSLFLMLFNPVGYEVNAFYLMFAGLATLTGGILIGVAAIVRQDWLARGGIVLSLSSIVLAPFIDLFTFIVAQTNFVESGCNIAAPFCNQLNPIQGVGQIFGLIFAGPLFLYALWSCIEYIWSGDR